MLLRLRLMLGGFLAAAVVLGGAEAAVRWYAGVTNAIFFPEWAVPDAVLGYRPSGERQTTQRAFWRDRLGFHDRRELFRAGERSLVALGDSCVAGRPIGGEARALPDELERTLREAGRPVRIVNAGVSGYTSDQVLSLFLLRAAPLRPQAVLVYVGWNDIDFASSRLIRGSWAPPWLRQVIVWLQTHSYAFTLAQWRMQLCWPTASDEELLRTSPDTWRHLARLRQACVDTYRANLDRLVTAARSQGIAVTLVTRPTPLEASLSEEEWQRWLFWRPLGGRRSLFWQLHLALNEEVRRFQQADGVQVIDLARAIEALPAAERQRLFADGEHPNDAGNAVLARLIAESLTLQPVNGRLAATVP